MVLTLACLGTGIATVVVGRSTNRLTADTGRLASLLAEDRYSELAALVAPADRRGLPAQRLEAGWLAAVNQAGALQRISRTYTVRDGATRRELELLAFENGTGTLSVVRTPAGITEMWLLVGTSSDAAATSLARSYALALVSGRFGQVVADFDSKMRAGLSSDRLATTTHVATDNLEGQPTLVAQVTTGHGSYVTVGNYLLYRNGLVRVQISFDADRKIAGLYLLSI